MSRRFWLFCLLALALVIVVLYHTAIEQALASGSWSRLLSADVAAPTSSLSLSPVSSSSVLGSPSLSAAFVDRVLSAYRSPAVGLGSALYADSLHFGIDDAYALAFFWHESTFGRSGVAVVTHSLGNIVCTAGFPSCVDGFRSYPSWQAGAWDWFHLLATEYLPRGLTTLAQIVPLYAPASENNVSAYIQAVTLAVATWRTGRVEVV